MNRTKLKTYAPQARRDFIAAVTERAALYGLTAKQIEPVTEQGDVAIVGGKAFSRSVATKRKRLEERITRQGFEQVMEAMAYTWFNRLVAIRFMELHGYLDHGYRVLSHPEGQSVPEIVEQAEHVDLPGLNKDRVIELKLDGTKEAELYRLLLIAQCNALSTAMPFLFERIDDETELLLPDNLLHSDSLIRKLVNEIDEEDWQEIEIIGWLYQFYISEKKDQVIGKVVKSEDIPAATQLFTPNWIVKYMVQNSLGAQWLATYPDSSIKQHMEYYIEPAEQTDEVKAQLAAITPSTLNPETLTLIDPASGSGHILVEAYELLKAIYLERGYRQRDVAQLILEKNLFGLDIDERAAQLTGFALMMKGRANDRRLFEQGVTLNVMALVDSAGFDAERLAQGVKLADYGLQLGDLTELKRLFEHATTFGSLIQVPEGLATKLAALKQLCEATSQDLFVSDAITRLGPLVQQAELLAAQYDAVVANPPYMGSKGMNALVKSFLKEDYKGYETDVFSAFIDRNLAFSKPHGRLGFMSPFVWMFISSHEQLRTRLIDRETVASLVQLEYSGFEGATVPICTFTLQKGHVNAQKGCYIRLSDFRGSDDQSPKTLEAIRNRDCGWFFEAAQDEFKKIPGSPVAYWASPAQMELFAQNPRLGDVASVAEGTTTGDVNRFLRTWPEVAQSDLFRDSVNRDEALSSKGKWFPYNKGGPFRKWFGNNWFVLNWANDGQDVKRYAGSFVRGEKHYFSPGITWGKVSSSVLSFRVFGCGFLFDTGGLCLFTDRSLNGMAGLLNSNATMSLMALLAPTLNFTVGTVASLPVVQPLGVDSVVQKLAGISAADWDAYERSWDFQSLPLLTASSEPTPTLESSYTAWITQNHETIAEMKRLEEENNRLFIDAYDLADELTPDVPIEQITLTMNPAYRYGGKLTEEEQWTCFRQDTMQELVSYAIGCMMGRYSLDAPGLIYAHSGNKGFDHEIHEIYEKKKTECLSSGSCPSREACLSNDSYFSSHSCVSWFGPDPDGIIPLTDTDWFEDDATHRLVEFISVAWDAAHLEDNLAFLADNLSPKKNEASRETIRRYLCDKFFKDHLQTYQNRPIYWLFSSGKQRAFQCLVYLHRYNEGTLSRMRTEYVIPLQGKIASRIEHLAGEITAATSTSHRRKLEKERDKLVKQQDELQTFDEKLRHYADQRISLDLDDGVKVNYGKFGDLLAEVKAVTGKKEE